MISSANMRTRALLITYELCFILPSTVESFAAANAKKTKIHASFVVAVEKDRETQGKGWHYYDLVLVLSGKNHFDEVYTQSFGALADSSKATETLGSTLWHVTGPHTLVRKYKWPNNVEIITINVDGAHCDARWESDLVPGADEHTLFSTYYRTMLHYKSAVMFSSACDIVSADE